MFQKVTVSFISLKNIVKNVITYLSLFIFSFKIQNQKILLMPLLKLFQIVFPPMKLRSEVKVWTPNMMNNKFVNSFGLKTQQKIAIAAA